MEDALKLEEHDRLIAFSVFQDGYSMKKSGSQASVIGVYAIVQNPATRELASPKALFCIGHCRSGELASFMKEAILHQLEHYRSGFLVEDGHWRDKIVKLGLLHMIGDDPGQREVGGFSGVSATISARFAAMDRMSPELGLHPTSLEPWDCAKTKNLVAELRNELSRPDYVVPTVQFDDEDQVPSMMRPAVEATRVAQLKHQLKQLCIGSISPLWDGDNFANDYYFRFPSCILHLLSLGMWKALLELPFKSTNCQLVPRPYQVNDIVTSINKSEPDALKGLLTMREVYEINGDNVKFPANMKGENYASIIALLPAIAIPWSTSYPDYYRAVLTAAVIQQHVNSEVFGTAWLEFLEHLLAAFESLLLRLGDKLDEETVNLWRAKSTLNLLFSNESAMLAALNHRGTSNPPWTLGDLRAVFEYIRRTTEQSVGKGPNWTSCTFSLSTCTSIVVFGIYVLTMKQSFAWLCKYEDLDRCEHRTRTRVRRSTLHFAGRCRRALSTWRVLHFIGRSNAACVRRTPKLPSARRTRKPSHSPNYLKSSATLLPLIETTIL